MPVKHSCEKEGKKMKLKFKLSIIVIAIMAVVVAGIAVLLVNTASGLTIGLNKDNFSRIYHDSTGLGTYDRSHIQIYITHCTQVTGQYWVILTHFQSWLRLKNRVLCNIYMNLAGIEVSDSVPPLFYSTSCEGAINHATRFHTLLRPR